MTERIRNIKLIVLDVDGTLTDGGVYIDSNGVETKKFNIKDGGGIALAIRAGYEFMILTGRRSYCVERRAQELKVKYLFQGVENKIEVLDSFMREHSLLPENVAYMGDDFNDLDCMKLVGFVACPADAMQCVKDSANFVAEHNGGFGAVREFCECILKQQRKSTSRSQTVEYINEA